MDPTDVPATDEPLAVDPATEEAEAADADAEHRPDRMPTPDEERIADELAASVDPATGEHYREMTEIGAQVEGEGRIEP